MSKTRFSVTFDIVTPESSMQGSVADSGFIATNVPLREALPLLFQTRQTRDNYLLGVAAIEANESPTVSPRWVNVQSNMEHGTGAQETRYLHIPERVTPASRRRIVRLVMNY